MSQIKTLLSLSVVLLLACTNVYADGSIEDGKTVKIDYTLTVAGQVVDTSEGKQPLQYTQGGSMIIPGLEKALAGLEVGDTKKITVLPADGYGQVNDSLIVEVPKSNLNFDGEWQKGLVVQMQTPEGRTVAGIILDVKEENLVLNFNHPLAGQELNFDVKVVEIQ